MKKVVIAVIIVLGLVAWGAWKLLMTIAMID